MRGSLRAPEIRMDLGFVSTSYSGGWLGDISSIVKSVSSDIGTIGGQVQSGQDVLKGPKPIPSQYTDLEKLALVVLVIVAIAALVSAFK